MPRYIDADELEKRTVLVESDDFDGEYVIPYASFEMMPTVDAVPVVHAHWEYIDNVISYEGEFSAYECSHCHKTFLDDLCENNGSEMVDARKDFKFCPFCGARMDEKDRPYKIDEDLSSDIENFKDLADMFCDNCASMPDGYCPTYCCMISRMQRVPFQNLKRSYIRNEGDIRAVLRYAIEWERKHEEKQE